MLTHFAQAMRSGQPPPRVVPHACPFRAAAGAKWELLPSPLRVGSLAGDQVRASARALRPCARTRPRGPREVGAACVRRTRRPREPGGPCARRGTRAWGRPPLSWFFAVLAVRARTPCAQVRRCAGRPQSGGEHWQCARTHYGLHHEVRDRWAAAPKGAGLYSPAPSGASAERRLLTTHAGGKGARRARATANGDRGPRTRVLPATLALGARLAARPVPVRTTPATVAAAAAASATAAGPPQLGGGSCAVGRRAACAARGPWLHTCHQDPLPCASGRRSRQYAEPPDRSPARRGLDASPGSPQPQLPRIPTLPRAAEPRGASAVPDGLVWTTTR